MTNEVNRLAFVVPVKSAAVSKDWSRVSAMFVAAVRSTNRQDPAAGSFTVAVGHEAPVGAAELDVDFVGVDLPIPERNRDAFNHDKASKLAIGFAHALERGATHVMAVDADDLVSRRLAGYVAGQPSGAPGWYSPKGYLWRGGRVALRNGRNFNDTCGTCLVVDARRWADVIDDQPWFRHTTRVLPDGVPLAPLPFPGAVYRIMNGENIFFDTERPKQHRSDANRLRYFADRARRYRPAPVSGRMRREFGMEGA